MKHRLLALCALATLVAVGSAQSLTIGSAVPKLAVAKWIKGKEVTKFEPGKTYVVEFWATWCGPCIESIPHITEMAKKFGSKVTFTGVSVWENQEDPKFMNKVEAFVKDMGPKMNYNVAAEGTDKLMAKTWMEAADQKGIPAAFVITDGKIAWIGHPMALEPVLEKVVAGTYDMKAAKEEAAKEAAELAKQAEMQKKMQTILKPVTEAMQAGDTSGAIVALDKVIVENPDMATMLKLIKFNLMVQADDPKLGAYATELAEGPYKDDAMQLNTIAWSIVDPEAKLKSPDFAAALKIAERAVEVSKGEDWMILDTLGLCQFKNKQIDKAIATQEKAVAMMKKDTSGNADADTVKEVTARLEMYKKAKSG